MLFETQHSSEVFLEQLQRQYPGQFSTSVSTLMDQVYDTILQAQLVWPPGPNCSLLYASVNTNFSSLDTENVTSRQNASVPSTRGLQEEDVESALKIIGFVFHKISLSISVILVLWVSTFFLYNEILNYKIGFQTAIEIKGALLRSGLVTYKSKYSHAVTCISRVLKASKAHECCPDMYYTRLQWIVSQLSV